ncbi:hypothetical protein GGR57DRAFT_209280 [Xylariaceae sp. FL1272]|nr:hypothetical protein GGR57DRAFT_209280 [Xylariaceae sp. FL1272]
MASIMYALQTHMSRRSVSWVAVCFFLGWLHTLMAPSASLLPLYCGDLQADKEQRRSRGHTEHSECREHNAASTAHMEQALVVRPARAANEMRQMRGLACSTGLDVDDVEAWLDDCGA